MPSARDGRPVGLQPGSGSPGQTRGEEVHKGAEAFCDVRREWRGDDPIVGAFVEVVGKRGDPTPGGIRKIIVPEKPPVKVASFPVETEAAREL